MDKPRNAANVRRILIQLTLLLTLMIAAGILSISLGQDANWDLQNYHIYNAFSLLSGHLKEVAGATPQFYLNPALDLPYYLLTTTLGSYPRLTAFIQGSQAGILWFLLWHITKRFGRKYSANAWICAVTWLTACTGSMLVSEVGTTFNDIPETILVVFGAVLVSRFLNRKDGNWELLSGFFLLGIAVGLKLTSAPYIVAAALALLFTKQKIRPLLLAVASGTTGIAVSGGWWFAYLYENYQSPTFPFINNVFHSEWWPQTPMSDLRFFPHSIMQWIAFPAYWLLPNKGIVTEVEFADGRVLIGLISAIGLMALSFTKKNTCSDNSSYTNDDSKLERFWYAFFIASYILWLKIFSIYRYAMPLECLSPLLCLMLAGSVCSRFLVDRKNSLVVAVTILALVLGGTKYPNWMRSAYSSQVFSLNRPFDFTGSIVIAEAGDPPVSYLFTSMKDAQALITVGDKGLVGTKLFDRQTDLIARSHRIYALTKRGLSPEFSQRLKSFWHLKSTSNSCKNLESNIGGYYAVCPLEKD